MKSDVSEYLELARAIYLDACAQCPAEVSSVRDLKTIRSRVEHEGISFLTITLPDFCKGIEAALEIGRIDATWRSTFFRRFKFHGGGPRFLSGFLRHLFDYETGRQRHEQDKLDPHRYPRILGCVRQICLAFKKLELGCTSLRNAEAVENFVKTEQDFSTFSLTHHDLEYFTLVSDVVWGRMVYHLRDSPIILRHGPGATAEGISGNRKFRLPYWYDRLDNYFPLFDLGFVTQARESKEVEDVSIVPQSQELPVKVTLVPKTLKSPRVIAIEPLCMQYAQQGIRSLLYRAIESYWLTAGHINFRDQSVNQSLALTSSADGRLATIDLSDASDRVPRDLSSVMFRSYPEFWDAIEACRSTAAKLPDGRVISPLRKFASMGSALCFPVESMYFYTICVAALLRFHNLPVSHENVFTVSRDIYVYGDDIIVPADAAEFVLDNLRKYNCRPNSSKTFVTGRFRESCGVDAFAGVQVQPVYLRKKIPRSKQHAAEIVSWSATANLFYLKGFWRTSEFMHNKCERILGFYPTVPHDSAAVGRIYPYERKAHFRVNRKLQRREVRGWVVSPVYRKDPLDGYAALTKSLLKLAHQNESSQGADLEALARGEFVFPVDERHLERTARHGACTLKLRWVAAT